MREFATKAEWVSENTQGEKVYRIEWVDAAGRPQVSKATGKDMRSALATVIKQRQANRLNKVPDFVWMLIYTAFITAFSYAAITLSAPLLLVLGVSALGAALKLATDRYFRFVEK